MNELRSDIMERAWTAQNGDSSHAGQEPSRSGQPFPKMATGSPGPTSQPSAGTVRQTTIRHGRLGDLRPDDRNANLGTERGRAMVEESLRRYGAGRSILVDRAGRIIAGNHVAEVAADIGLDDCIVVPTDGRALVVVQRTDLDLDSPAARALTVADNRTSEVGLQWDSGVLAELAADEAVDLSALFSNVELASLLGPDAPVPAFAEAAEHEQGRLDQIEPVVCPKCGHAFER